ncbi:heat-inducible transcription repressor [Campylobacter pinnipediorum subsp. caledonicus]|uniref:Heat-inducible transcription repressor n=1 Tax=Campylobacter pinnipediorum subsp. caledonicus TaxID=1874362 RepID=A0A1S6U788_9BACT|nr:HrcA family transcriptional regulator [Campylobacter pinnipediorum]AQW85942.1 heat-inducible transcription repressor [Campylobacter pinnipediorum subsp. caledonicus]AQW87549.1 heat-inducible transcription repressor [Campylobacter pinnipediorum subsp. caledonicus]OPA72311.1 HrcA family transcriptional regulator [Campylobacter pinnipediorum subsp. caledonicus]
MKSNKISKRDIILNSIIDAYIEQNIPIGSNELGSRMDMNISASTIRVYFKKLSDEGEIMQLHISGGRIPTVNAMQKYWNDFFYDFSDEIVINDENILKFLCDKHELYCMIFGNLDQNLEEILNVDSRFLVLNFTKDEIVLKYDIRVEKFLSNLIGVSLNKLELVSSQVGLSELRSKIRELKRTKIYFQENEILALKMFENKKIKSILEPSFENFMKKKLTFSPLFEDGFMGLKLAANYKGEDSIMVCSGSVYANYIRFLNNIKEVA